MVPSWFLRFFSKNHTRRSKQNIINKLMKEKRYRFDKSTRIVEGYEPNHRPWMTFIQLKLESGDNFICGGSIINKYWILSAGHCFCDKLKCKPSKGGNLKTAYKPSEHVKIVTGLKDFDLSNSDQYQRSEPQKIIIHPS